MKESDRKPSIPYYAGTDRVLQRSRFYHFRKKYLRSSYFLLPAFLFLVLISNELLKEPFPSNTIQNVSYRRNRVILYLNRETVLEKPEYRFEGADSIYCLTISPAVLLYESHRSYRYGDLAAIDIQRPKPREARIRLTFSNLADTPGCVYMEDPPRFVIDFNRHLDDQFVVVLDPGHGGGNIGARGRSGTIEKTLTLEIADRLRNQLNHENGLLIFLTRENDIPVELHERSAMSQVLGADLFISIHANSAANRMANWPEVYCGDDHSLYAARIFLDELEQNLGIEGFIRRRRFAVLRNNYARLGALLVETSYLSNAEGDAFLTSEQGKEVVVGCLLRSVKRILEEARIDQTKAR